MEQDPESLKEFTNYLLEQFKRGVESKEYVPMMGGYEGISHQVAAKAIGVLLDSVTPELAGVVKKIQNGDFSERIREEVKRPQMAEEETGDFCEG